MLKLAMKMRARAAESHRKTAAAAAEVAAEAALAAAALAEPCEPLAPTKPAGAEKPAKSTARDAPPASMLTEKERKKLEKKLLEQRRKEEKKREKERKKLEKMQKKQKKGPAAQEVARGVGREEGAAGEAAAAGAARGGAGGGEAAATGATSRAWASWEVEDDDDEDDVYYGMPHMGGLVWRPGPHKSSALSVHLPLAIFLVFSVRSPSWVLNFLLQRRSEQGRGCGFIFGATCCFRVFLGCAFFGYLGGRVRRRARGRFGGASQGARRRARGERLI